MYNRVYYNNIPKETIDDHKLKNKIYNEYENGDYLQEVDRELLKNTPTIDQFYTEEEKEFYSNILKSLDKFGIKYFSNNLLVRGLDYYTSTVFEFTTTDLGAQSTILAGGRYDSLVEEIGGVGVPAVGFGGGLERLMLLINENLLKKEELIAIIPVSENENEFCLDLSNKLRNQGKRVEFLYSGKFKKKMEKINKIEADFAIIVGEDEVKSNKLKIKNLKDGSIKDFNYENK